MVIVSTVKEARFGTVTLLLCSHLREKKRRLHWVRPLWIKRKEQGIFHNLVQEIRLFDQFTFFKYLLMSATTFDKLLRLIAPQITKIKTNFREPLPPAMKLLFSLRFLATGEPPSSLSFGYRLAFSTVCEILGTVPKKIWEIVGPQCVSLPRNKEQWQKVSDDFWKIWNFPNCLGAIDGKHCQVVCPAKSGS